MSLEEGCNEVKGLQKARVSPRSGNQKKKAVDTNEINQGNGDPFKGHSICHCVLAQRYKTNIDFR